MEEARQHPAVEVASVMLAQFLCDESDWWSGELQTLTGYFRHEFEELMSRITKHDASLSFNDRTMLHTVANTLLGYPFGPTPILDEQLGEGWQFRVNAFILRR